jgi:RNA polymerase sigma-70 factor, ECF subfamily
MSRARHVIPLLRDGQIASRHAREGTVPHQGCEDDERALLGEMRAGSREACEAFVRRHAGWMRHLAQRYLKDRSLAEDCVQEAFLQVFRSIGAFEGRCAARSWLYRIVVNAALMRLRSQRCAREQCLHEALPLIECGARRPDARWGEVATPQEILQRKQACDLVSAKLAELSDGYRIVLLLRDIQGFSTQEVARMLDITEGAVKVRLHRARSAFRALVAPVLELYI